MKNPKVSVVIPSFNRFKYLEEAIESVKNQTYKNTEIIVINDESTEKKYYQDKISNVSELINIKRKDTPNWGGSRPAIRNYGINQAKGDYIAFLDDDDYWMPNKLELQIGKLETGEFNLTCSDAFANNGMYDVRLTNKRFNQEIVFKEISDIYKKSKLKKIFVKRMNYKFEFPEIWDLKFIKVHNCIITSSVVVDKNLIVQIGKFRDIQTKKLYSDWDCWLGLLTHTDCYYFSEPLIYYDLNDGMNKNTL